MKKILCIADGISLAHPTRLWQLSQWIDTTKYTVVFATHERYTPFLKSDQNSQIEFHHIPSIDSDTFNQKLDISQFHLTAEEVNDFAQTDSALIQNIKPDLVVSDFRFTILPACNQHNIPVINLTNYHWHPDYKRDLFVAPNKPVRVFGRFITEHIGYPLLKRTIERNLLNTINERIEPIALNPTKSLEEFYCFGDHLLFADLKSIYKDEPIRNNETFLGPVIFENNAMKYPENWPTSFDKAPIAFISMGSTGNHAITPKVAHALDDMGFQVLISTSGHDIDFGKSPNIHSAKYVPYKDALQYAHLLVCNGGSINTYHAFKCGVPVLAFPSNFDQGYHMTTVKRIGIADFIYHDQFNTKTFSKTVSRLLESSELKRKISEIQKECASLDQKSILNKVLGDMT
jgi:UDP:flavonoid glycosyltransferase YjiC (YdhE family)